MAASFCRGYRQILRCRGSILPFGVRSFAHSLPLSFDSADPKPTFESPSVFESCLDGKKSSDDIIHDQMRWSSIAKDKLTTEDMAAVLRFVKLNAVKRKIRDIPEASVSYQKLLKHCLNFPEKLSEEEGKDMMKRLEESGGILRIGQTVYSLSPQMARAVQNVRPRMVDEQSIEELRKMKKEKAEIEKKSQIMARRELWFGLGFFAVQTIGLLRLTFWELSWDIMEPICFYLTSLYFMLGYAFFLRTLREPSFENLYAARVEINRMKMMKRKNFDLQRYRDLQRICEGKNECADDLQRKMFVQDITPFSPILWQKNRFIYF